MYNDFQIFMYGGFHTLLGMAGESLRSPNTEKMVNKKSILLAFWF